MTKMGWLKRFHNFLISPVCLDAEINWMKKVWYLVLLIATSVYVFCNFSEVASFSFFADFDGDNMIFLLWIALLLFPFFDSFEGFGLKIHSHRVKRLEDIAINEVADSVIKQNSHLTLEELKECNHVISKK